MVTILGYHEIVKPSLKSAFNPFEIDCETFEAHVRMVKEFGFKSIGLADVLANLSFRKKSDITDKVIFTFDDGHISNYLYAKDILIKYGFKGAFFITTSHIGLGNDWMNTSHIREMVEVGMEIGSHTHSHPFLNDLSDQQIFVELTKSKEVLEQIVNEKIRFLSCPGGRFNDSLGRIAQKAGYSLVCTSIPGYNRKIINDYVPFLERYIIKNDLGHTSFFKIITQRDSLFKNKLVYHLKVFLKKLIGNKIYYFFWKKLKVRE